MGATDLLADLQRRGLRIRAQGDALIVEPRSSLTDELRATIRANKPAILRELVGECGVLPAEMERRIRVMAIRWNYSADELRDVLDRARRNPTGWVAAVALDERRFGAGDTLGA